MIIDSSGGSEVERYQRISKIGEAFFLEALEQWLEKYCKEMI